MLECTKPLPLKHDETLTFSSREGIHAPYTLPLRRLRLRRFDSRPTRATSPLCPNKTPAYWAGSGIFNKGHWTLLPFDLNAKSSLFPEHCVVTVLLQYYIYLLYSWRVPSVVSIRSLLSYILAPQSLVLHSRQTFVQLHSYPKRNKIAENIKPKTYLSAPIWYHI